MSEPVPTVCVGVITGAHGVRGLVKVQSYTHPPEAIWSYSGIVDPKGKPFELQVVGPAAPHFLAKVKHVTDRNAAEALRGTLLNVPRSHLPAANEGEFYHADLVGMIARSSDGRDLGIVRAVLNFGASDILDIKGQPDFMVPFTDTFVPDVDLQARTVTIADYKESQVTGEA